MIKTQFSESFYTDHSYSGLRLSHLTSMYIVYTWIANPAMNPLVISTIKYTGRIPYLYSLTVLYSTLVHM